ncbi:hypothetical protein A6A04_20400 [Paramagnetospirillum marisnigri]|uniref:histidine kinase n=1 Tax=Paramagnetospirillum marisnigri TaxID=1285242 RepID=A0A178MGN8_9PROT|nr:ATP-binding protein [Paramagnetospirillum marisnigri]OAN47164.1 hypothetical protein A6A04_20400 [Paramagnetospirillum marisnigri]
MLPRWWPLGLWAAVVLAIVLWVHATLSSDHDETMAAAERRVQGMAELAGTHVLNLFDSAHAAVKVAIPIFSRDHDWDRVMTDQDSWRLLRDLGEAQPNIPTMFMADEAGRFRLHAKQFPTPERDLSQREYFRHLKDTPGSEAYVSEPLVGLLMGWNTLILSRRVDYPDGRFAGLIGANIDPKVPFDFFATLGVGPGGIVTLQRTDGTILVRHPRLEGAEGSKVDNRVAFPEIAEGWPSATRITVSPLDGVARITSFKRLDRYGLVVLAATPIDEVLAPWRIHQLRIALVVGIAILVLSILLLLLMRRRRAEITALEQLRTSEANLIQAQQVAKLGYYVYDMVADRWESSAVLDEIFGIDARFERTGVGWLSLVAPSMRWSMAEYLGAIQAGTHDFDREYQILRRSDGALRWVAGVGRLERDESGKPIRLLGTIKDITEQKEVALELQAKAEELTRSNTELEQFAYVASHDLREPLRMVSSYVDLLERRYCDKLDEQAREFIGFARDGAKRMDRLVLDLLEYSRIGRLTRPMEAISLDKAVDRALRALTLKIEEANAEVIRPAEGLPVVWGDGEELSRLFQNLIGNAIKYRDDQRPPKVRLSARRSGTDWDVVVEDNGIGIDPQYFDRIFLIFNRLHRRGEFEGTGIGLAICKKIIEHHGGRISVESVPGKGSSFKVTLRAAPAEMAE